jgi:hypothetical protein
MVPTTQEKPQEKKKRKKRRKARSTGEPRADRERDEFTPYQNEVYKRAVFGLSLFNQKEINQMHWERRQKIKKTHKLAQKLINILKQIQANRMANWFFREFFPDDARYILETPVDETEPTLDNKITFKDLGITKKEVTDWLIAGGALAPDFYQVRKDPNEQYRLPRLKTQEDEKS